MVRVSDPPDAQLHVSTDAATATTPLLCPWLRAPPLPRRSEASVGMACSATLMRLVCSPFARSLTTTTTTSHTAAPEMTIGASTRVGCGAHYPAAWRSHGPRTQSMADPQRRHTYSPHLPSAPHPTPHTRRSDHITAPASPMRAAAIQPPETFPWHPRRALLHAAAAPGLEPPVLHAAPVVRQRHHHHHHHAEACRFLFSRPALCGAPTRDTAMCLT